MASLVMRKIARLTQKTTIAMISKRSVSHSLIGMSPIAFMSHNYSYRSNRVLFCTVVTASPTSKVRSKHAIDESKLLSYLNAEGILQASYIIDNVTLKMSHYIPFCRTIFRFVELYSESWLLPLLLPL